VNGHGANRHPSEASPEEAFGGVQGEGGIDGGAGGRGRFGVHTSRIPAWKTLLEGDAAKADGQRKHRG